MLEIFHVEFAAEIVIIVFGHKVPKEFSLTLLKNQYFLFDTFFNDGSIDGELIFLPDSMGPIDRLAFDGRIPPWIHEKNITGGCKVKTEAPGLKRNKKNLGITILKEFHLLRSLLDGLRTINPGHLPTSDSYFIFNKIKIRRELREDQSLVAFSDQLLEVLHEKVNFSRLKLRVLLPKAELAHFKE